MCRQSRGKSKSFLPSEGQFVSVKVSDLSPKESLQMTLAIFASGKEADKL